MQMTTWLCEIYEVLSQQLIDTVYFSCFLSYTIPTNYELEISGKLTINLMCFKRNLFYAKENYKCWKNKTMQHIVWY